jgi:hypothetical protein
VIGKVFCQAPSADLTGRAWRRAQDDERGWVMLALAKWAANFQSLDSEDLSSGAGH